MARRSARHQSSATTTSSGLLLLHEAQQEPKKPIVSFAAFGNRGFVFSKTLGRRNTISRGRIFVSACIFSSSVISEYPPPLISTSSSSTLTPSSFAKPASASHETRRPFMRQPGVFSFRNPRRNLGLCSGLWILTLRFGFESMSLRCFSSATSFTTMPFISTIRSPTSILFSCPQEPSFTPQTSQLENDTPPKSRPSFGQTISQVVGPTPDIIFRYL
mmetsp:Transcript_1858/g.4285  ORF Transcript_1858/g.4285 Transcript_1858/m.4285 type:complete len:217 (-) Transcript_1858:87-737(-)